MPKRELALVMPVYNEEACIVAVVASWRTALALLGINFEILVLNDGSSDRTWELLGTFRADGRITLIDKPNEGHGPTILKGYALAAERAEWVFQADSDGEIPPGAFAELWKARRSFDAIFGERAGRAQPAARRIVTALSRAVVLLLFGGGVADVNTPYRLIRAEVLGALLREIPPDTFAPNVMIAGLLALTRARILNLPVPYKAAKSVTISLKKWRLWAVALRCLSQTVGCRLRRAGRGFRPS